METGKIKMKSIKIGLIGVYSRKTSFIQRYINGDFDDNFLWVPLVGTFVKRI